MRKRTDFVWRGDKNLLNIQKHGISFETAQRAFEDPNRVIAIDHKHSTRREKRFFCYGKIEDRILTVRFVWRNRKIRIFGAGFWREGRRKYYEKR